MDCVATGNYQSTISNSVYVPIQKLFFQVLNQYQNTDTNTRVEWDTNMILEKYQKILRDI